MTITWSGTLADRRPVRSDSTRLDFRNPVRMTVVSGSLRKDYTVCVHSFMELPVVWVETRETTSHSTWGASVRSITRQDAISWSWC